MIAFRFLLLLFAAQLSAQTPQLAGIINHYAAVTAIDTCNGILSIDDTTGFRVGGAVLLVQMQGVQITTTNNSSYGQIQNLHAAGRYERVLIDSVAATAIFLKNRLFYNYSVAGHVQVVTIPQYTDAMVTDTVRAQPWNGTIGGILALEVTGTLTLNAPLWAEGAGFRGGTPSFVLNNNCNFVIPEFRYHYAAGNWRGAYKGEGVAVRITGRELGRGPQANGGGGGNDHNSGGGGGGSVSRGGRGGENDEPSNLGCDGYYPGLGGYALSTTTERLFLGGGGGAGHANNGLTSAGAAGGGIIMVQAGRITGTNPLISANGNSAETGQGDGGGGGGAGGTIWLRAITTDASLLVQAQGGNGGDTNNNAGGDRCFGPGGGGSGGYMLTNLLDVPLPGGGQPGIIKFSTGGCNGSSSGATPGENGLIQPASALPEGQVAVAVPIITEAPQATTVCAGDDALFVVQTNAGAWTYQWQLQTSIGGNWQNLVAGPGYSGINTDSLQLNAVALLQNGYRYRAVVRVLNCAQTISSDAMLTISAAPTAAFTTMIDDRTVTFSNQSTNATSYMWSFGNGGTAELADPQFTYAQDGTYTVMLFAINACDTAVVTQQVTVLSLPTANFAVPDSTGACLSATLAFQNLSVSSANSYQWSFPGGNPASSIAAEPNVTYTSSGDYTAQLIVANANGQDTLVRSFYVEVIGFANADFDYLPAPGGVVIFTNQSLSGTTYSWDFGDNTPSVAGLSPTHQYTQSGTYVVTLSASNACGVAILQQNIVVTAGGVGTSSVLHLGRVRLFPNPVGERLTIDCSAANAQPLEIQILDITGRLLLSQQTRILPVTEVSLNSWPSGTYMVVLRFAEGRVVQGVVKK